MKKQQNAKAAKMAAPQKAAKKAPEPRKEERRMLTAEEYRALEKAAHALETALRIRRKYQFAVLNATECVNKNLDRLIAIAREVGK